MSLDSLVKLNLNILKNTHIVGEERLNVVATLLKAGKKAKVLTAYPSAVSYLRTAAK